MLSVPSNFPSVGILWESGPHRGSRSGCPTCRLCYHRHFSSGVFGGSLDSLGKSTPLTMDHHHCYCQIAPRKNLLSWPELNPLWLLTCTLLESALSCDTLHRSSPLQDTCVGRAPIYIWGIYLAYLVGL